MGFHNTEILLLNVCLYLKTFYQITTLETYQNMVISGNYATDFHEAQLFIFSVLVRQQNQKQTKC